MWLNKTEIKKIIKAQLNPFYKEFGFKYKAQVFNGNPGFIKSENGLHFWTTFNASSGGGAGAGGIRISAEEVERLLFQVRYPNMADSYYENGFNPINLTVFEDSKRTLPNSETLYKEEEVITYCSALKNDFLDHSLPFIQKYNTLDNINELINEIYKSKESLFVHVPAREECYFKVLVIAYLLKDQDLKEKLNFITKHYYSDPYYKEKGWVDAFEQLLQILGLEKN